MAHTILFSKAPDSNVILRVRKFLMTRFNMLNCFDDQQIEVVIYSNLSWQDIEQFEERCEHLNKRISDLNIWISEKDGQIEKLNEKLKLGNLIIDFWKNI